MNSLKGIILLLMVALLCPRTTWGQDLGSAGIAGHIQFGSATTSLIARLYSRFAPNVPAPESAGQAGGTAHTVRVAYIGADGKFEFSGLRPDSYLLEIYSGDRLLYQKVVSTQDPQPLEITLVFTKKGWQPIDMTLDSNSGVFVLDRSGTVSKLIGDQPGAGIDKLFQLPGAYRGVSVAASGQWVYVAANSAVGCSVFRYALSNKAITQRSLELKKSCVGIATDGTTIYVTLPQANEIRYLSSWDSSSYRSWGVNGANGLGPITFDRIGNRLIVADHDGNAFAVSMSTGAQQLLASNLGWINSLATSRQHILVASGKKVLSLARSDNRGENPPLSLQSLTGGYILGVVVDDGDRVWFADYDKDLVQGPLPLN